MFLHVGRHLSVFIVSCILHRDAHGTAEQSPSAVVLKSLKVLCRGRVHGRSVAGLPTN